MTESTNFLQYLFSHVTFYLGNDGQLETLQCMAARTLDPDFPVATTTVSQVINSLIEGVLHP